MRNSNMQNTIMKGQGFIAALDQSGGSTPKALAAYGVAESEYSGEDAMYAKIHEMRSRIIKAPAFSGGKVIGAILFEKTMDAEIDGTPTAEYLWKSQGVVPFLKVDKGLEDEAHGVQLMKAMPELDGLLERAVAKGIYGTKMRSTINSANAEGIAAIVAQQFEVGKQIIAHGLVPIIEPEVNIHAADKAECEALLNAEIKKHLDLLNDDQHVMLKLTLPEQANFYSDLIVHKNVQRVVALSGGYDLDEACKRLSENDGMIASFSRALSNDLRADQTDAEFNATLQNVINKIQAASVAKGKASQAA
ncbi:MAG: fructose bisphosphate aldolase [Alphaproteobacteria bacterium]|nr:fructose bisphosphate aldolase [Alphaproteobacteria bacterium]NCQ87959.1 fructose bisphosphate aldolase [Alphaproteobacteria bacterium]NCT05534.1 fructose bisphosphate aldolase [Alphaproteobacteria bacterium]